MADSNPPQSGVQTTNEKDRVLATAVVNAPADEVFEFIRRPANHVSISGDQSVVKSRSGPEVLSSGDRFGMSMKIGVPYNISNKVVEFEQGRKIAWQHFFKHTWRWEVEPVDEKSSRVTETYDISTARIPQVLRLAGMPGKQARNVETSVLNLQKHFAGS